MSELTDNEIDIMEHALGKSNGEFFRNHFVCEVDSRMYKRFINLEEKGYAKEGEVRNRDMIGGVGFTVFHITPEGAEALKKQGEAQ